MLKKIQQDFSYYSHEFKDNYRKGVHRLRTILASRAQAQAFVSNAGGVAVVLGYEPETPDKNAQELYALLMASPYIDDAVQTFSEAFTRQARKVRTRCTGQRSLSGNPARSSIGPCCRRRRGKRRKMDRTWQDRVVIIAGTLRRLPPGAYRDERGCRQRYRDERAVAANSPAVVAIFRTKTALDIVKSKLVWHGRHSSPAPMAC